MKNFMNRIICLIVAVGLALPPAVLGQPDHLRPAQVGDDPNPGTNFTLAGLEEVLRHAGKGSLPSTYFSAGMEEIDEPQLKKKNQYANAIRSILSGPGVTKASAERRLALKKIGRKIEKYIQDKFEDKTIRVAVVPLGSSLNGSASETSDVEYLIYFLKGGPVPVSEDDHDEIYDEANRLLGEEGFHGEGRMKEIALIPNMQLNMELISTIDSGDPDSLQSLQARAIEYLFLPVAYGDAKLVEGTRKNMISLLTGFSIGATHWDDIRSFYRKHIQIRLDTVDEKPHLQRWLSDQGVDVNSEKSIRDFNKTRYISLPDLAEMGRIYSVFNPPHDAGLEEPLKDLLTLLASAENDPTIRELAASLQKWFSESPLSEAERRFVQRSPYVLNSIRFIRRTIPPPDRQVVRFHISRLENLSNLIQQAVQQYRENPHIPGTEIVVVGENVVSDDLTLLEHILVRLKQAAPDGYPLVIDQTAVVSLGTQGSRAYAQVNNFLPSLTDLTRPFPGADENSTVDDGGAALVHEAAHHQFMALWTEQDLVVNNTVVLPKSPITRHRDPYNYLLESDGHLHHVETLIGFARTGSDPVERRNRNLRIANKILKGVRTTLDAFNLWLFLESEILTPQGEKIRVALRRRTNSLQRMIDLETGLEKESGQVQFPTISTAITTATQLHGELAEIPTIQVASDVAATHVLIVTPDGLSKLSMAFLLVTPRQEHIRIEALATDEGQKQRIETAIRQLGLSDAYVHDVKAEFGGNVGEAITSIQWDVWTKGAQNGVDVQTLVVTASSGLEEIAKFLGVPKAASGLEEFKAIVEQGQSVWS